MSNRLIQAAKEFYPKVSLRSTIIKGHSKPEYRYFQNYPKNKGSYSELEFRKHIARLVMEKEIRILKGVVTYRSKTSMSIYFECNGYACRISDHHTERYYDKDIIISLEDFSLDYMPTI